MENVVSGFLLLVIGWILYDEFKEIPALAAMDKGGRLCDYSCGGSTFEPVSAALARGIRLIEVHVYSDEQDQPVVALHQENAGVDHAYDNVSFESVCVTLVNEAFPSDVPLILSIVPHTSTTFTLNRIAYHLSTTLHKHFAKDVTEETLLGALANKLVIVSGPEVRGSNLEELVNLNWGSSSLRRLEYQQAAYPRDPAELSAFNKDHISMVAPSDMYKTVAAVKDLHGCQWNLISGTAGFLPTKGT